MATIKPFAAYRPTAALAQKTAALPYDVLTTEEARLAADGNPYSFLHVDKAEIGLAGVDLYDDAVYAKAAENLNKMIENGWFVKDSRDCLYVYSLETQGRRQTGLVALTTVDEYISGVIKKHELTRTDKENDRARHIESCEAHTGPIFLAYEADGANNGIRAAVEQWTQSHEPEYSFESGGVTNTVWTLADDSVISGLVQGFASVPSLYICDGHHRNAAAASVGLSARKKDNGSVGDKWYDYCLSVVFPSDELYIMPYNRIVKDLNGHSTEDFLRAVSERFDVSRSDTPVFPKSRREFGMCLGGQWYALSAKPGIMGEDSLTGSLGVSILHSNIIEPLLGVADVRSDPRISFIGGADSVGKVEEKVSGGEYAVGFTLFATSMKELMSVAGAGGFMPPKSTWFEPKLLSGLFVHNAK